MMGVLSWPSLTCCPDVASGKVSMDGTYWMIPADGGRTRRRREMQFFPPSLVLNKPAKGPRREYSPQELAERRAKQQALSAARREQRVADAARERAEFAQLVHFLSHGREVLPGLFIGGRLVAEHDQWLDEQIDFVFNCSAKRFPYMERFADRCVVVDVADDTHVDLAVHFDRVTQRIGALLRDGKRVLVHCFQGKSRSAAIIAAYLVSLPMSLSDALDLVDRVNHGHQINDGEWCLRCVFRLLNGRGMPAGFMRQLMAWEMRISGSNRSSLHGTFHKERSASVRAAPPEDAVLVPPTVDPEGDEDGDGWRMDQSDDEREV